jgi:hypothetical protein
MKLVELDKSAVTDAPEENPDKLFRDALGSIEEAIGDLRLLVPKFIERKEKEKLGTTFTQLKGLQYAAQDLQELHDEFSKAK